MDATTSPTVIPPTAALDGLRAAIAADLSDYLANLERMVNTDCGSYTPSGVNAIGRWTGDCPQEPGAPAEYRPDPDGRLGDTVVATFRGPEGSPSVLMIGHLDTVFDAGT